VRCDVREVELIYVFNNAILYILSHRVGVYCHNCIVVRITDEFVLVLNADKIVLVLNTDKFVLVLNIDKIFVCFKY